MSAKPEVVDAGSPSKVVKIRRKLPILLILPYLIGIAWHAVHPLFSVLTGEKVPRKVYVDENSLEPSYFRMDFRYDLLKARTSNPSSSSKPAVPTMCQALESEDNDGIICVDYNHSFPEKNIQVTQILPSIAVTPVTEALVLVVPSSPDWLASQFHASVLQLIRRLSTAPWLAKSILVVSSKDQTLSETVNVFLEQYLGSTDATTMPATPPFTGAMLRNLIVLDSETTTERNGNQVRILAQGRRGLLPNMDLTVLGAHVYRLLLQGKKDAMVMHPHRTRGQQLLEQMQPHLPAELHDWASKFIEFVLFEYTLLMGPYPPHAGALERGIDALTIQGVFEKDDPKRALNTAQFVQKMEPALRGLSNLHERLHHSTSLYLLVSSLRFVKHEEYLVPNLLLIIPLVIRAVFLILTDISTFDWQVVGSALSWTLIATLAASVGLDSVDKVTSWLSFLDPSLIPALVLGVVYIAFVLQSWLTRPPKTVAATKTESGDAVQSLQFFACLLGLCVNVPLAFGHVSLSFPSALLWTPLVCFSSFSLKPGLSSSVKTLLWVLVLGATWPATWLVPHIFATYTVYVRYGYLPLHLCVTRMLVVALRHWYYLYCTVVDTCKKTCL